MGFVAADWLATGSLAVAAVSLGIAAFARRDARESAHAAKRSADAAEASVRMSERATVVLEAQRADQIADAERDAVVWDLNRKTSLLYILTNIGLGAAHEVTISGPSVIPSATTSWAVIGPSDWVEVRATRSSGNQVTVRWKRPGSADVSQRSLLLS